MASPQHPWLGLALIIPFWMEGYQSEGAWCGLVICSLRHDQWCGSEMMWCRCNFVASSAASGAGLCSSHFLFIEGVLERVGGYPIALVRSGVLGGGLVTILIHARRGWDYACYSIGSHRIERDGVGYLLCHYWVSSGEGGS